MTDLSDDPTSEGEVLSAQLALREVRESELRRQWLKGSRTPQERIVRRMTAFLAWVILCAAVTGVTWMHWDKYRYYMERGGYIVRINRFTGGVDRFEPVTTAANAVFPQSLFDAAERDAYSIATQQYKAYRDSTQDCGFIWQDDNGKFHAAGDMATYSLCGEEIAMAQWWEKHKDDKITVWQWVRLSN